MIDDDVFVIDAVAHGYNYHAGNQVEPRYAQVAVGQLYGLAAQFVPDGFLLPLDRWVHGADPDLVGSALFGESATDYAIYHEVPMFGVFTDGGSPVWVGTEMRKRWPGRVGIYAGVSPFLPDAVGQVDRAVEELGAIGLKLYPFDLVEGRTAQFSMGDPEIAYPIYQRALERGIKNIAVHKALPLGPVPLDPFRVGDVESAAAAFPDLMFQIVHGGMAFVEETAMLLGRFSNVCVNLEGTMVLATKAPLQFATIIGSFLQYGAEDRIMWATGCMGVHPKPFIDAFWAMDMPQLLMDGYGLPPLTKDIKRKVLGLNAARICGIDIPAVQALTASDEFAALDAPRPAWSGQGGPAT